MQPTPATSVGSDVYQLLSGTDFAVPRSKGSPIGSQIASQMGNYVYMLVDTCDVGDDGAAAAYTIGAYENRVACVSPFGGTWHLDRAKAKRKILAASLAS